MSTAKRSLYSAVPSCVRTFAVSAPSSTKTAAPKSAKYIDEGEVVETPRPSVIENSLINAGIILERTPIILPEPEPWECEAGEFFAAKEARSAVKVPKDLENSLYSKFRDPERLEKWKPLPRLTEDDKANNRKSLYRKLDEPVYLIVKVEQTEDKSLPKQLWRFPTTEWRAGETIRQSTERTLFYHIGEDVQTYMLGNAPILHIESAPTAEQKKEFKDVKTVKSFFMHSLYLAGNVDIEEDGDVLDYAWVTQGELAEYFTTPATKPLLELTERSLYYGFK